ncbi:MAG: hypothetical protein ACK4ZN_08830 [Oceanibaculum sp.]
MSSRDIATHRAYARRHAMKRAWHRFGLAIGEGELREIERNLVDGLYAWVADLAGCCVAYEVRFRDRVLFAVFNIRLWAVVTFLPSEAWARRFAIRSRS